MTGRKLLIALTAAVLYAAVLVATASAQAHQVRVTLVTGRVLVLTVDVPPGGSIAASLPAMPASVQSVEDLGAVPTPTPTATAPPAPAPGGTATPGPAASRGSTQGSPSAAGNTGSGASALASPQRSGGNQSRGVGNALARPQGRPPAARRRTAGADRARDGTPTRANPTLSIVKPGAAAIGVPNFFIDKFRIPPFLLPIYQAAGIEYGVRWEVLAAINEIETDYGRNLNVSTAGAVGWMQFLPSTWKRYGVDANGDGQQDPYNPADAIFAAARYLRAAGGDQNLRGAIFAYNHATWYVDSVLLRARVIAGLPADLVGSLTGLTQGRFPVQAKARYAGSLRRTPHARRRAGRAVVVESVQRKSIDIFARSGSPVVATNDGRIVEIGASRRLGRFVTLQDVYGNTYTYGDLGRVARRYPVPKRRAAGKPRTAPGLGLPRRDAAPAGPASRTRAPAPRRALGHRTRLRSGMSALGRSAPAKQRLFAHPRRPNSAGAGGTQQEFQRTGRIDGAPSAGGPVERPLGLPRREIRLRRLRKGAHVVAGTVLGRVGRTVPRMASHLRFEIRPAGRGAPRIDPKPILDGWKLLETTAIYRAAGRNPFVGGDAPSIGQILLMGKDALARRVLDDPRVQIYPCGRRDVRAGQIDRRVLATLEFLAASGFKPTVTSLECGHSLMTASGNVSEHSVGDAVDIAAVNGIPILGHQGPGSITELVIQRLLTLQGTMEPHQIISLMRFAGARNTMAMGDHADHIHIGFHPMYGSNSRLARQVGAILRPRQWLHLIDRLGRLDEPTVRRTPSRFSTPVRPAPHANRGD
jgi:hypothetical protein